MEACPKLEMYCFDFKKAQESINFGIVIKKLIRLQHHENPEEFSREIEAFTSLRNAALLGASKSAKGLEVLKKYYCQLHFFQNRFKLLNSAKKGPFDFPWMDLYDQSVSLFSDLNTEMAFVLYDIGVMQAELGNLEDRGGSESLKNACSYYQSAAWAFHSMPDLHRFDEITDLNPDYLAFLSQVCLAQAQECILEKSILDHRKPLIIAKVGAQVVDFYKQAHRKITASKDVIRQVLSSDYLKAVTKFAQFKMLYYNAVSHFFMGLAQEEDQKWGMAVAFFQKAHKLLAESSEVAKVVYVLDQGGVGLSLIFANDVIKGKFDIAKRENEFIYHEKVPEVDQLEDLKGQCLVKGIGFQIDEETGGKDIFANIVPLEAHAAASLYSEEKAKILRELGAKIDAKDEELNSFLVSLNLEQVPNAGDFIALPQELIECAAGFSLSNNDNPVKRLSEAMSKLAGVSADVQAGLDDIQEALVSEQASVKEFKGIVGKPPKSGLDPAWSDELKRYKEAHKVASESNQTLHKAMQAHIGNLKTLSRPLPDLQKGIPSMADLDSKSEADIAEFQRVIKKVDEMRTQRASLLDQIRDDILNDDITKKLVLHKNREMPDIFTSELTKHDVKKKYLEQNLAAQENIIKAMTEINAKYAPTRKKVANLLDSRKDKISSLVDSFNAHESLLEKAKKALEFYQKLMSNVTDLLRKVKKSIEENGREMDAVMASLATPNSNPGQAISSKPTLKDYMAAGAGSQRFGPSAAQPSHCSMPNQPYMMSYQPGFTPSSNAFPPIQAGMQFPSTIQGQSNHCATSGGGQFWPSVGQPYPSGGQMTNPVTTQFNPHMDQLNQFNPLVSQAHYNPSANPLNPVIRSQNHPSFPPHSQSQGYQHPNNQFGTHPQQQQQPQNPNDLSLI